MIELDKSEVTFWDNGFDDTGYIFMHDNRVFRAINPAAAAEVRELLASPLFRELNAQKLLVPTHIAEDISLTGFELILEHRRIPFFTRPGEWSFEMLKTANLTMLEIFECCRRHGYTLKDGHPWNLTFLNAQCVFVDIGSFVKKSAPQIVDDGFLSEYMQSLYLPLKMWAHGQFYLANRILADDYGTTRLLPSTSLFDWSNPLLRAEATRLKPRLYLNWLGRKFWQHDLTDEVCVPWLRRRVGKLRKTRQKTVWQNYHQESYQDQIPARFRQIADMLKPLPIRSMIDLAGNQGLFSVFIGKTLPLEKILCLDYDANAVDSLYLQLTGANANITPGLSNIIYPERNLFTPLSDRQADLAVALALTHHLLLGQNLSIDKVLKTIGDYSSRHVLIEFMPLGLWDGINAPPPVPPYYNEDFFTRHFEQHFKLLQKCQLEPNRIVFLGEHRP